MEKLVPKFSSGWKSSRGGFGRGEVFAFEVAAAADFFDADVGGEKYGEDFGVDGGFQDVEGAGLSVAQSLFRRRRDFRRGGQPPVADKFTMRTGARPAYRRISVAYRKEQLRDAAITAIAIVVTMCKKSLDGLKSRFLIYHV